MGRRVFVYGLGGKFCLLLLLASSVLCFALDEVSISKENDLEIERKLNLLNKPAVKTIQSEDGDIIDCVDIHKQPSLDHPALKHHKIQMKPTITYPKTKSAEAKNNATRLASQIWQKSGSCPEGTIPIRRIRKQDLLRAGSLDSFGRKSPYIFNNPNNTVFDITPNNTHNFDYLNQTGASNNLFVNRSTAFLLTLGYHYIGVRGEINVWNPQVEKSDEYTTGQIWLVNGPRTSYDSAEAGWMVNPTVYGDTETRFFAYWTADGAQKTGCFDLMCQGFVQTSSEIVLGGTLAPISSYDGPQYYIALFMYWDKKTRNWWLEYGGKQVGYWPSELFVDLKFSAIVVQWGGEVYSKTLMQRDVNHTSTSMGSGIEAQSYQHAAWIRHVRIIDYSGSGERYPEWVHEYMDEPYCYSSYNWVQYITEPVLYFGGKGRSYPYCP